MVDMTIHFPDAKDPEAFTDYYFGQHYPLCMKVPNVQSVITCDLETRRQHSMFVFADENEFLRSVSTRAAQDVFWDTFQMPKFFFPRFQKIKLGGDIKHPVRFRLRLYWLCVLFMLRWYK